MNSRRFVSIAVPVLAFLLTVAVSLWQRRAATPPPEPSRAAQIQPHHEIAAVRPIEEPTEARADDAAPAPPEPTVEDESDPSHSNVPAKLMVHPRTGQSGVLATLQNTTADQLDVTVTAVSAKTHMRTVVDVTLHPLERKNLDAAGLEVALGDQVTLQSSPYRDTTILAR